MAYGPIKHVHSKIRMRNYEKYLAAFDRLSQEAACARLKTFLHALFFLYFIKPRKWKTVVFFLNNLCLFNKRGGFYTACIRLKTLAERI